MYRFALKKQYDNFQLDVDFSLDKEETMVILGPSGCGKSTLLNLITGVTHMDKGYIRRDADIIVDTKTRVWRPIYKRNIGYIQQKSNLFPHMSVMENLCYGLRGKKDEATLRELDTYIHIFRLDDKVHLKPSELSGGQQQRVSIIRAIMSSPDLLLFDEPFSALDNPLRLALREELLAIKERLKVPIIFVTHDLEEGHDLGDRIMIMDKGRIVEEGITSQIYHAPKKLQTARLLGIQNIWESYVRESKNGCSLVDVGGITLSIQGDLPLGEAVTMGIKAADIFYIKRHKAESDRYPNVFHGKIIGMKRSYQGYILTLDIMDFNYKVYLQLPEYVIYNNHIKLHDFIHICIKNEGLMVFERDVD